jgi:hypothetical protein
LTIAVAIHLLGLLLVPRAERPVPFETKGRAEIEIEPLPAEPPPAAAPQATLPLAPRPVLHPLPHPTAPGEPPPPAARAGPAVVVPDADDTQVTGPVAFAGGVTQAAATSSVPTYDPRARAWGIVGGDGEGGGGFGPDLSRPARLGPNKRWSCPSPPGVIGARFVRVRAWVLADGQSTRVEPLESDDDGILRVALPCALREHYVAGTDRRGRPAATWTLPFRIVVD